MNLLLRSSLTASLLCLSASCTVAKSGIKADFQPLSNKEIVRTHENEVFGKVVQRITLTSAARVGQDCLYKFTSLSTNSEGLAIEELNTDSTLDLLLMMNASDCSKAIEPLIVLIEVSPQEYASIERPFRRFLKGDYEQQLEPQSARIQIPSQGTQAKSLTKVGSDSFSVSFVSNKGYVDTEVTYSGSGKPVLKNMEIWQ